MSQTTSRWVVSDDKPIWHNKICFKLCWAIFLGCLFYKHETKTELQVFFIETAGTQGHARAEHQPRPQGHLDLARGREGDPGKIECARFLDIECIRNSGFAQVLTWWLMAASILSVGFLRSRHPKSSFCSRFKVVLDKTNENLLY